MTLNKFLIRVLIVATAVTSTVNSTPMRAQAMAGWRAMASATAQIDSAPHWPARTGREPQGHILMLDPNSYTPSAVRAAITEHGGLNPFGGPMWRVVLAEKRLSKKKGIWHTFPNGNIEQFRAERRAEGGHVFSYNPMKATSVEYGVRETPRYPCKGWILEKWLPPEVWMANGWDDNLPRPTEGDYWMLGGPWEELPELNDLKQAISNWQREWESRPKSFEEAYAIGMAADRAREERELQQYYEDLDHFFRSEISPVFKSTSLEAQRIRNDAVAAAGGSSHLGAGQ